MDDLLKCESDWETLQIIYNSFMRQELASASGHSLRKKYFNNLGHLYPSRTTELNSAKEFKELQDRLTGTPYWDCLQKIPDPTQSDGPEIEQLLSARDNVIGKCLNMI